MANIKKYIVETPVKDFCGVGAGGIQFAYGKATVYKGHVLDWYRKHGYKVTEIKEPEIKEPEIKEPEAQGTKAKGKK